MQLKHTFDNGLRLITAPMPHTRAVSMIYFFAAGGCYETQSESGISHFIEHLCFRGTEKRRTSREITEAIEQVGGIINGGTDKELTTYWCTVASEHNAVALDVLSDLVRNARFDAKDIESERQIIIEEIHMSQDSPIQLVDMMFDELLWPNQAMGRDVAGTDATVGAMTRDQITDYVRRHYQPNTMVISVAGDIDVERIKDTVGQSMRDWKSGQVSKRIDTVSKQTSPRLKIGFRDIEQVHLCLGVPGLSLFHDDRFALRLLSIILGEGMSSRLFLDLREKEGLAYDVSSYCNHYIDSGAFVIYAGVDAKKADRSLTTMLQQLFVLKDTVSAAELAKSKALARGRILLSMESSLNVARWGGNQELLGSKMCSMDEIISLIDAVKLDDLKRVAEDTFRPNLLNLTAVGPLKDENVLRQLLHNAGR